MFQRTRIKLTAWYLLIIMTVCLFFTVIIYSLVNQEFVRFERMQIKAAHEMSIGINPPPGSRYPEENLSAIKEARGNLITRLFIINLGILVFSGVSGYFLAGRTLNPIKKSMDEQKRFISDSSHELRTPLASLRTEIEVGLLDKNLNLEKSKKILKSNLEEVIELQTLSDRLLELAQNGNAINKNSFEKVSVKEIIDSAVKKTEKMADAKKIKLTKKSSDVYAFGIPDRLTETVTILIDNAIKYSPRESKIEVLGSQKNDQIKISVIDHGQGISEEDIELIFDRFYRAEKSRSEEGFGLGLSIAKKIAHSHNGHINVDSTLNKGSTFTLVLPKA